MAQRLVEKEMTVIATALRQQGAKLPPEKRQAAIARLTTLRERLAELFQEAKYYQERVKGRLQLLNNGEGWEESRLDRLVGAMLLRQGYLSSAQALIARHPVLSQWLDVELYTQVHGLCQALLVEHDLTPALTWCQENRAPLRKLGSTLEFNLRRQEMVNQLNLGDRLTALQHARQHLKGSAVGEGGLAQALCLLALSPQTQLLPYRVIV